MFLNEDLQPGGPVERLVHECLFQSKLRHPNIVQLIGVHTPDPAMPVPIIIMEYLPMIIGTGTAVSGVCIPMSWTMLGCLSLLWKRHSCTSRSAGPPGCKSSFRNTLCSFFPAHLWITWELQVKNNSYTVVVKYLYDKNLAKYVYHFSLKFLGKKRERYLAPC